MNKNPFQRCLQTFLAIWMLAAAHLACGQALDSVDVARLGNDAEITIRFGAVIQYLRHAPAEEGQVVRIYIAVAPIGINPGDLQRVEKRVPKSDIAPQFTVVFPERDNSLSVNFSQPVHFIVRPGPDGRSIKILLPSTAQGR